MRQRGFSLLEVLVAFSILALSLGVLMQIFSGSIRNADISRERAQAVAYAKSLLASAGVETTLAAGESTGTFDGKYQWVLRVAPSSAASAPPETTGPTSPATLDLWEVSAQITWGGDSASPERALTLTTLRVQAPTRQ